MNRVFYVSLKRVTPQEGEFGEKGYVVLAPTAKLARDKATLQFKEDNEWKGTVLVEQ